MARRQTQRSIIATETWLFGEVRGFHGSTDRIPDVAESAGAVATTASVDNSDTRQVRFQDFGDGTYEITFGPLLPAVETEQEPEC